MIRDREKTTSEFCHAERSEASPPDRRRSFAAITATDVKPGGYLFPIKASPCVRLFFVTADLSA
jgi:hypothetical protein